LGRLNLNKKEDVEKLTRRIKHSFQRITKTTNGSEDCAQQILLRMLEGRHQHSTIDQAVIDYLRANHGNPRVSSYLTRKSVERAAVFEPRDLDRILELSNGGESFNGLDLTECSGFIGGQTDRAVFWLTYKWGLSEAEIGNIFKVSESRISQRISRIQKCIHARVKAKESRETSGEVASVLRPEAERQLWGMGEVTFERMETGKSFGMASFNEKSF
jgi:hypothetical protein